MIDLDNPNVEARVKQWMREYVEEEYLILLDEKLDENTINMTELAEIACDQFDLFEPPPDFDCPEEVFYWAYEVSCEYEVELDTDIGEREG